MSTENHWKEKYLSALDNSEAIETSLKDAEDTLRLTISRLTLAAGGSDKKLDEQFNRLKSEARKSSNNAGIRRLLEEISTTIKRLDVETSAGSPPRLRPNQFLALVIRKTEFPKALSKKARALEKKLGKKNAVEAIELHLSEFVSLVHDAFQTGISTPSSEEIQTHSSSRSQTNIADLVADLTDQLRDKFTQSEPVLSACSDLEVASTKKELNTAINKLVQLLPNKPTKTGTTEEPFPGQPALNKVFVSPEARFRQLIDQLSLPTGLTDQANQIRETLDDELSPNDWPPLLSKIADMVALMRSEVEREKTELQAFLFQITNELQNIDASLVNTEEQNIASLKSGEHLDNAMRSNFSELQASVESESELGNLRQIISQKMEKISTHLQEYRDTETQRQEEVSTELRALRSRVQNMESETTELNEKLTIEREQARTDPLTGINNRVAYKQRLMDEFESWKKGKSALSTIVCDIDHFKNINDTLGHQAGDKALQSIASVLKQNIRKSDFLARYGGEEFVVLISHDIKAEENVTAKIAEKIRAEVELAEFKSKGNRIPITISCGYSSFRDGDEIDSAFGRADKALYRAKEQGRNRVEGDTASL